MVSESSSSPFPLSRKTCFVLLLIWMIYMGICLHWGRFLALFLQTMWCRLFLAGLLLLALSGLFWSWQRVSAVSGKYAQLRWGILLGLTLLLGFCIPLPIERAHIALYGVFGFLLCKTTGQGVKSWFPGPVWLLTGSLSLAVGIGDELIQHYHPQRVGDLRDVVINALSSWLGIGWSGLVARKVPAFR